MFSELGESLSKLPKKAKDKPIIMGGDFNLPGIDWKEEIVNPGSQNAGISSDLINLSANEGLTQVQEEPTRENNILDLYFTNCRVDRRYRQHRRVERRHHQLLRRWGTGTDVGGQSTS